MKIQLRTALKGRSITINSKLIDISSVLKTWNPKKKIVIPPNEASKTQQFRQFALGFQYGAMIISAMIFIRK